MKKSEMLALLQNVKTGKVKIDDAISQAETSRRSLIWEKTNIPAHAQLKIAKGFLYKVENGEVVRVPEVRDGKVFQPYYRSLQ